MNTDISIYVPVYNGEKTIEKCINSILKQTIQPKKILIINDKSEDKTSDILTKYLDKIEVINNEKNMGVSYARNFAIKNLKTKYIASIDADVELSNNWLEQLINIITEKKITLIGGKMYEKYINNPFNLWRSLRLGQNWGENDLLNPKFVFGCNNLLDVSKIDKIDNYRTDLEYFKTNGEDIEFSNMIKKKKLDLYYCSKAICYHLQDDDALSLSKRYWRYMHYGDGLKKRGFFKTFKNLIRQMKKTLKWTFYDLCKFNFKLIKVNFLLLYYFIIIDIKFCIKKKYE
tara:strand:- start:2463 stop:3323 length:861 start_codon:yes stop_codon:yes gene_type:complete